MKELGEECVTYLVHDAYYKDLSHMSFEERTRCNFDQPESLDTSLLIRHIQELKCGESVNVPVYDFEICSRCENTRIVHPRKIMIVEGILLFCEPELMNEFDVKVYVDADSDVRLSRRLTRDTKERGRTVEQVLEQYHRTVKPMHEEWVQPTKRFADIIIRNTGHSMDVAVGMISNHLRTVAGLASSLENGNGKHL